MIDKSRKFYYYAFIIYSIEVGVLLFLLPWLDLWEKNYFFQRFGSIGQLMNNLYVRGAISGLGILSIIIAFSESYKPN